MFESRSNFGGGNPLQLVPDVNVLHANPGARNADSSAADLGSADDMFGFNFAHALILSPQLRASQVALTCEKCSTGQEHGAGGEKGGKGKGKGKKKGSACAGINRFGIENESILRRKFSQLLRPSAEGRFAHRNCPKRPCEG